LSIAAQNPKHRSLRRPAPPLRAPSALPPPLVPPRPTDVRLVHCNCALEDRGHLPPHRLAQDRQGSQDPLPMQLRPVGNGRGAQATDVASQEGFPRMPGQAQRQPRSPIVPTPGTPPTIAANYPGSGVATSGTPMPSCHPSSLPNQVAGMRLYPREKRKGASSLVDMASLKNMSTTTRAVFARSGRVVHFLPTARKKPRIRRGKNIMGRDRLISLLNR
jgi:hypothetical protein